MVTRTQKAKPVAATKKATVSEPPRVISEICRLVARWRFCEADQTYQSLNAKTEEESERLIAIHNDEQKKIEARLTELAPESFRDIYELLELAIEFAQEGPMEPDAHVYMLQNIREAIPLLLAKEIKCAAELAVTEAHKDLQATIAAYEDLNLHGPCKLYERHPS